MIMWRKSKFQTRFISLSESNLTLAQLKTTAKCRLWYCFHRLACSTQCVPPNVFLLACIPMNVCTSSSPVDSNRLTQLMGLPHFRLSHVRVPHFKPLYFPRSAVHLLQTAHSVSRAVASSFLADCVYRFSL